MSYDDTPASCVNIEADLAKVEQITEQLRHVSAAFEQCVVGQNEAIMYLLTALLSGGHALLVGAPGLGKTLLARTAAHLLGLDTRRIQFTPDLMPSDITGSDFLEENEQGRRQFRFLKGPIFTQLLLADEINRASPRTQSALLQAMQENEVAQNGTNYPLPRPFHVIATQNPLEHEGTYPLPEAQLDRFLMRIKLSYPNREAERQMLLQTTGATIPTASYVLSDTTLTEAQHFVRRLPVGEKVTSAILSLVRGLRPETALTPSLGAALLHGPGPRAAQALMLSCRALALLEGRLSPNIDDVFRTAQPVLAHRMALSYEAQVDGKEVETLIEEAIRSL